ncbi:DUF559 domain-containing protein [Chlorobaculum tepidum]|nr:DUF559 domain-containing protein [Chlorobaculum tepidum]
MARKNKTESKRPIESYEHRDKERVNNPPVGLVTPDTDPDAGQKKKTYAYDPHLDPQLVWTGKAEHTSFEVPTVSLHVHERIDPRTIIEAVRKRPSPHPSPTGRGRQGEGMAQLPLFEEERKEPLREAVEFYRHAHGWSNRLIAGDSLLVMNSLLEKEGMAGKVQMIYIDPPYGIKYGSNFQPFVNKRDVKDGKDEDLTAEPEQIRAFRDTWELGIHSYLTYLRDRLLLARELLTESGSIFVQISDENVHHVRELMDEVFGARNFQRVITIKKRSPQPDKFLSGVADYLIWFSKDRDRSKYNQLYWLSEGEYNGNEFVTSDLTSSHEYHRTPFEHEGQVFSPGSRYWSTSIEGLTNLARSGRLVVSGSTLRYKRFNSDWPCQLIGNIWDDVVFAPFLEDKLYAVQTSVKILQRCLLMTTDPGDLVFDPTCGSGTTAYVAEQWGRRWITCDTSRVALTLARQRLMTAVFDYYELAYPSPHPSPSGRGGEENPLPAGEGGRRPGEGTMGVWNGFKYKTVPHVTLKSIANNPEIDGIYARWQAKLEPIRAQLNALLFPSPQPSPKGRGSKEEEAKGRGREENPLLPGEGGRRPGEGFEEWQIPREPDAGWPEKAKALLADWWQLRRQRQEAIDAAIARHAPQETLYDQPFVDKKKTRVTGPFTVEAVPAPAVKSVDEILSSPQPSLKGRGGEENPLLPGEGGRRPGEGKKPLDPEFLEFARQLRKEQTDAEQLLWFLLRDRRLAGLKFRRQHPVEPYVVDFYCHEARLAVELDGGQHNEPDERARDAKREAFLEGKGIRILRFWNNDVLQNTEGVLQAIYDALVSLTPALSQGERELWADASIARSGETLRQGEWRDELLRAGIRGKAGQHIRFARLEPLPGCRWLHADGETRPSDEGADRIRETGPAYSPMRVVVSFGPDHAPLEQRQVQQAWEEARMLDPKPKLLVFAAFQFDPEAAKDIDEMKPELAGMQFLKVQMNADLLTDDLKKKRATNESFWLIGQPDVEVRKEKDGRYVVEVHGFDYYNTKNGGVESGGEDKIAVWLLDTDYDSRSLYPRQVFFPMTGEKDGWARLAKNLKAEIDEALIEAYRGTVSLPFAPGAHKRIAVKIVDDRGIESLKVMEVE